MNYFSYNNNLLMLHYLFKNY